MAPVRMSFLRLSFAFTALSVCLSAAAGNRMLDTPTRFSHFLGESVSLAVSADFTGDSNADVLHATNGSASVARGRGDGSFSGLTFTITDGQVRGIADFDEDGHPDLYLRKPGAAYTIMLGVGDGTFGEAMETAGGTPDLLTAGDFNGDNFDDVLTFSAAADTLTLYAGNGAGAFSPGSPSPISFPGIVRDLAGGDFDGDGKLDLVLAGDEQSVIAWNNGAAFTAATLAQMPGKAAAAGDVNGDGRTDAVVIDYGSIVFPGTASIAFGSNIRSISVTQFAIEGSTAGDVIVAQMDGLGGVEIITAMRDVTIHSHDGVVFRAPRSHAISDSNLVAVTAADFDGDGKIDVVATPGTDSSMSLLPGNGDGTLTADPAFQIRPMLNGGFKQAVNAADLNGDGRLDLTLLQYDGVNLAVAFGTASGFAAPVLTTVPQSQRTWDVHRAGDLNADGRPDVMLTSVSQSAAAQFSTWLAQANGTYLAGPFTTGAAASRAMLVADLTGDGRADVVDSGGRLYVAQAGGGFSAPAVTTIAATSWMFAADLDHDGRVDVTTWTPSEDGLPSTHAYLNHGGGSFGPAVTGGYQVSYIDGIVDATADGVPDIISSGEIFPGRGDGTFGYRVFTFPQPDFFRTAPWTADFDGDATLDLAVSGVISYGGGGTFESAAATAVKGEIFSLADLDGNGSPDLWLADAETARIAVIRTRRRPAGTAVLTMSAGTVGGSPTDRVVSINGNLDRSPEIAETRGSVLVQVSSANQAVANQVLSLAGPGGWSAAVPVPTGIVTIAASYSGDGYYAPAAAPPVMHTVEKHPAFLGFYDGVSFPDYGTPLVLCASVSIFDPDTMPPATGVITYSKGGTTLGTSPASPAFACQGSLSVNDPALFPAGSHTIDLDYPGDDGYLPGHSQQLIHVRKVYRSPSLSIPSGPLYEGQTVTITASFANVIGLTGNVTFTWNGTTHTVPVTNAQAVLTTQFPWGSGELRATYSGDANYRESIGVTPLVIYRGSMSTAPIVQATAALGGAAYVVTIAYSQLPDAASYDLYHSINGAPLTLFMNRPASTPGYPTEPLANGSVAVYAVVARAAGGGSSPMSARDLASAFTFTDDPLLAQTTIVRGMHVSQLQTAVNAVRTAAGLATASFAAPSGPIAASHLTSLRTALTQARSALGLATPLTDSTITPGVTKVRTVHFQELREAMK